MDKESKFVEVDETHVLKLENDRLRAEIRHLRGALYSITKEFEKATALMENKH